MGEIPFELEFIVCSLSGVGIGAAMMLVPCMRVRARTVKVERRIGVFIFEVGCGF